MACLTAGNKDIDEVPRTRVEPEKVRGDVADPGLVRAGRRPARQPLEHLVGLEAPRRGMARPRAWSGCRLMTSSNFVRCVTGTSAGFAPCKFFEAKCARLWPFFSKPETSENSSQIKALLRTGGR